MGGRGQPRSAGCQPAVPQTAGLRGAKAPRSWCKQRSADQAVGDTAGQRPALRESPNGDRSLDVIAPSPVPSHLRLSAVEGIGNVRDAAKCEVERGVYAASTHELKSEPRSTLRLVNNP